MARYLFSQCVMSPAPVVEYTFGQRCNAISSQYHGAVYPSVYVYSYIIREVIVCF